MRHSSTRGAMQQEQVSKSQGQVFEAFYGIHVEPLLL
jgi:hypothetical protein